MPVYKDQCNRDVVMTTPPQKIISLVPSQTELLYDLGLRNEVIGITKFCVHPNEWFTCKTRIGGTKNVQVERIKSLQPDLIIANREENVKEQVELLAQDFPVWVSDINNLEDALQMIRSIGVVTSTSSQAENIIQKIKAGFEMLAAGTNVLLKICYLIWKDPYMTVGGDTFINDMLLRCGMDNVFKQYFRYPSISLADIKEQNPQLIMLSSEPYPFKEKHLQELQLYFPKAKIVLVNGEMFSWYGSRLQIAASYFKTLINTFYDNPPGK